MLLGEYFTDHDPFVFRVSKSSGKLVTLFPPSLFFLDCFTLLNTGLMGFPKMSQTSYRSTPCTMPEERRSRNPYSKFRFVNKTVGKAHFNSDNPNHIEYDIQKVGMECKKYTKTLFSENTRKLYSSFSNFCLCKEYTSFPIQKGTCVSCEYNKADT